MSELGDVDFAAEVSSGADRDRASETMTLGSGSSAVELHGGAQSLPPASTAASSANSADNNLPQPDPLLAKIAKLKAQQKQMREEKKGITKSLRNAERQKKRLRTRARQLTDEDLFVVLRMRQDMREHTGTMSDARSYFSTSGTHIMGANASTSSGSGASSSTECGA